MSKTKKTEQKIEISKTGTFRVFMGAKGRAFVSAAAPGKRGIGAYNLRQGKVGRPIYRLTEVVVPRTAETVSAAEISFTLRSLLGNPQNRRGTKAVGK